MRKLLLILGTAAVTAACGGAQDELAGNATANAAAPKKERPAYCFFKDAETKGWSAARDAAGNIVVKGQAYRSDSRYKAVLGSAKVSGAAAEISPSITVNDTGFAAPENWWDVSATIPDSAAVQTVTVRCGKKALAELKLPFKR